MITFKMDNSRYLGYSVYSSTGNIPMDTKTKALISILCLVTVASIAFLYYRSYISQDFDIDTAEQLE